MSKIKFIKSNEEWTRLVRHIRINGEVLNIEEGEGISNDSCHFENGHVVEKASYGLFEWRCYTMLNNQQKGVLEKVISFMMELDPKMNFASGYINGFSLGKMEFQKSDFPIYEEEFSKIFGDKIYWDKIE